MVFTVPVPRRGWARELSRRELLAAALATGAGTAGALSGCSLLRPDPPPPPDPLEPLLAGVRALAGRYATVIAAHPDLAGRLDPLARAHAAHAAALVELIGRPELATPAAGPGGSGPASSAGSGTWTPPVGDADAALAALREAEREGRREAARACLAAPPERAGLVGSIAAARASHAEALR
jgi:hypothetical protein